MSIESPTSSEGPSANYFDNLAHLAAAAHPDLKPVIIEIDEHMTTGQYSPTDAIDALLEVVGRKRNPCAQQN